MKRKTNGLNGNSRKGVADFMLLILVVGIVAAIILFGSYFSFLTKIINIKGQVNIFMVNDDAGTELVSLLNAKNGSAKHIELLGSYLGEFSDISPVENTLKTAFGKYDFTYSGIASVNFKQGVPPIIQDSTKSAIIGCGTSASAKIELKWPLDITSNYLTSGFGGRELSSKPGQCDCHGGIDIRSEVGKNVYASISGTVELAKYDDGYGNHVVISSMDGNYRIHYAHLSDFKNSNGVNLKPGDQVIEGTLIGKTGNTGASEAPHLHFEVRISSNRADKDSVNPCELFKDMKVDEMKGLACEHAKVASCSYVSGMISGKSVRSYDTDIPLPGAKSGNIKGTVVFKQWD